MNERRSRPHDPNLGVGTSFPQPLTSGKFIRVNFVITRFNIDGHETAYLLRPETFPNDIFVDRVTALGKFSFGKPARG